MTGLVKPVMPEVVEVASDVFAVLNSSVDTALGGFGANQGFVLLEESALVFDTGFSKFQADFLVKAIRKISDKPIRFVVNSHDHSDHMFGNSIVARAEHSRASDAVDSILIISHDLCRMRMRQFFQRRLDGYRSNAELGEFLGEVELHLPNFSYSDNSLRIHLEGLEMYLLHPETGAHTLGDTVLALPKSGVLFAGDIIWNRFYPNLEDANLEGWIDFLADLDVTTYHKLVPGHGDIANSKDFDEFFSYLKHVRSNLAGVGNRAGSEEKRKCFIIPGTESWMLKSIIDLNVETLFGSL